MQQKGDRRRTEDEIAFRTQRFVYSFLYSITISFFSSLERLMQDEINVDDIRNRVRTQIATLVDKACNNVDKVVDRLVDYEDSTNKLMSIFSAKYDE